MDFMELLKEFQNIYNISAVNRMYEEITDAYDAHKITEEQYDVLMTINSKMERGCY